ncbi:hypothetical protein V8E51_002920 [Hyaloscypha variabilis]
MASAPSQASQRRSSPSERPASPHASPSIARTQSSPDSDVVVVGASQPRSAAGSIPQPKTAAAEIRRCWVCMGDETDDPENNIWRSPCPCSLIAHESCLLEWIADKESPPPGQIAHTHEIKCPQCQTPLKILRPRDPLVTLTDGVQRIARSLILPTALCGVVGCFYSGFLSYGANTLALVFGTDAANALLAQPTFNSIHTSHIARWLQVAGDHGLRAFGQLFPFFPRVRSPANIPYYLGLPLIGPSLVLWRTSFGDIGFSMLIPIYFFDSENRVINWPPAPGLAFATLPYLRTAYTEFYKYTFGDLEKKWDRAVMRTPREGETAEQIAAAQAADEEEHAIFELEIVREVEHEHDPEEPIPRAQNQAQAEPQAGENIAANGADGAGPGNGNNAQGQNNWPNGLEFRQDVSATLSADTIMGALFFPAVAAAMGEVLKISLPARWVGRGVGVRVGGRGLLMEKWGRSLVGGCIFVVLKDVVTLYCKWRKARDFGKRKVLDFVGKKKGGDVRPRSWP